jgi:hypothetical protein
VRDDVAIELGADLLPQPCPNKEGATPEIRNVESAGIFGGRTQSLSNRSPYGNSLVTRKEQGKIARKALNLDDIVI